MRNRLLHEKLYIAGGAMALCGVGLVLSIMFAGAGVVLLTVAVLTLLAGLIVELLAPQYQQFREGLRPPTTHTRATPKR